MSRSRILIAGTLLLGTLFGSVASATTTQHTFLVKIHRKVSPGQTPTTGPCQTTWVKFTMSFATDPGVTITGITAQITEPDSPLQTWPSSPGQALTPNMTTVSHLFPTPPTFGGVTPLTGDTVYISAPDQANLAGYDTANYQRYEIDFQLTSNYDLTGKSYQQFDPDTYTVVVNVTTSGTAATVSGLCAESYDPLNRSNPNANCASSSLYWMPITDPLQTELWVDGTQQAVKQCFRDRKGVDAFLVLDKSGSMASSTTGSDPEPKIEALQEAVRDFVNAWDDTRTFFDASPPADQIGVALFDQSASSWTNGGLTAGLNAFAGADSKILTNLNPATCTATSCGQLVPGTSTSIGSGLLLADPGFPNDTNRHVVLLMSDGMQNTDPMVTPYDPTSPTPCGSPTPTEIATYSGNCTTANPLPHEASSNYQLHAVTVGTGLAVSAAINQAIAQASGGFYINTEDNANQLKPFFLELLQNVLKFNSYDTIRMISKSVPPTTLPFSTSTPVSTSSRDVEFNLTWPRTRGALRLTVTPPGGAKPIVKEGASGFISIVRQLPLPAPFDPTGNWNILVEAARIEETAVAAAGQPSFPFDIYVMADDGAIKSDLSVVPADYKAGDSIRLRAKLTQLGSPILGLGSHPGDKIQVDLIKPGQSIGDILSDSTASAVSSASDPQSPAEAKLFNTLQNDPSALVRNTNNPIKVTLFDDGRPEHGDDVAGDGIYSGLYSAILPGHYNFLFSIESTDPNFIRFSRQQLRTAYVRSVPDAGNTVFKTSILRRDNRNVLSIVMTPRVKPGPGCLRKDPKCGRMGPGWANYFWFTAPGQTPFKPVDNLKGTYTATLAFNGSTPPPVSFHFENVLAVIGDSVTPDHLPDPLGPGNVVTVVPPPKGVSKVAVFFGAGAAIPHGTFGNAFNTGFSLNAGLEYILTTRFSAEGIFGYHHFPAKVGSALDLYQFSGNGKFYLSSGGPFRPFINAGIGGYDFTPGGGTHFGGNVGAGLLRELNSHWGVQGSYNFHAVNTPGAATKFSTVQVGIRYVF
jgi:hypothetical protein